MDIWPAYITALKYYSYHCIVFDPYHLIASCNKMLDELRSQEAAGTSREQENIYTDTRYLHFKGGENVKNNIEAKESKDSEILNILNFVSMPFISLGTN